MKIRVRHDALRPGEFARSAQDDCIVHCFQRFFRYINHSKACKQTNLSRFGNLTSDDNKEKQSKERQGVGLRKL